MERPARLFLCAGCRVQVVLCSHCDRGNLYCSRPCWRLSRDAARRDAAHRYQSSWRGRLAHAERSRRWRQRHAARSAGDGHGVEGAENVTHQGSQPGVAAAPLAAWTHDTTSSSPDATTIVAPGEQDTAPAAPWTCCRCTVALPACVRQGFLRHGPHHGGRWPRTGWRHDRSP
jgi:hypothetical protein